MIYKEKFTSPQRTLELIEIQANAPENVSFAKKYFPPFNNGIEIWEKLKPITRFKADPKEIDTIQGISTLFSNTRNIHGVSGLGDCDCFTSALASIAISNKLPYQYIIQGNDKPSHIAIKIDGTILDLTNPIPDYLRQYQFTKYINPMFVALADDGEDLAMELNDNSFDFGRRPNIRKAIKTAARFTPAAVVARTAAKYSPQALALKAIQRQGQRIMRTPQAAVVARPVRGFRQRVQGGTNRVIAQLPPAAKAQIMLRKRQLRRFGYGDSEAELLAIENFADDFGRRKISLKRGVQNVGKFAKKAAPFVLPVAGAALNLVAPGVGGKVAGIAAKGLKRIGGQRTLTTGQNILQRLRPSGGVMQAAQPEILSSVQTSGEQSMAPMQVMNEPVFPPSTFVTPAVPVTAQKINPMLLIGGAAVIALLLTRK